MEQLLIIEDDIALNQGLSKALRADDRRIISCPDMKTAKEQLLCCSVSLILLDINLPDGSGLDLLKEIKEKAAACNKKVYLAENCGMSDERVYHDWNSIPDKAAYFSLVVVR